MGAEEDLEGLAVLGVTAGTTLAVTHAALGTRRRKGRKTRHSKRHASGWGF